MSRQVPDVNTTWSARCLNDANEGSLILKRIELERNLFATQNTGEFGARVALAMDGGDGRLEFGHVVGCNTSPDGELDLDDAIYTLLHLVGFRIQ